ncbi:MAG TPA: 16S rRNA (cytidine(1402)-2'-O)-methyltransferase [Candidatus Saccharimonadales bacterium]|nr:16S rRNA (cytidine(1402)-2'-O)-methyltransferase [Candidatus Saccharimonadales bacterium]
MGTLYIVATPIGNLQDITLRAVTVLQSVDAIACEDTRKTGNLLRNLPGSSGSKRAELISYYEQNELQRIPEIINGLTNGLNIALVSDAGTPAISDPGFKLIRECIAAGIKVESIPGPSSVVSALVSSGLPTDKFLFVGYLPKKQGKRQNFLKELAQTITVSKHVRPTVIFFESPYRIVETLHDCLEIFGDIEIAVARELTKVHEETRKEKISILLEHFQKTAPKGEFVILFHLDE